MQFLKSHRKRRGSTSVLHTHVAMLFVIHVHLIRQFFLVGKRRLTRMFYLSTAVYLSGWANKPQLQYSRQEVCEGHRNPSKTVLTVWVYKISQPETGLKCCCLLRAPHIFFAQNSATTHSRPPEVASLCGCWNLKYSSVWSISPNTLHLANIFLPRKWSYGSSSACVNWWCCHSGVVRFLMADYYPLPPWRCVSLPRWGTHATSPGILSGPPTMEQYL